MKLTRERFAFIALATPFESDDEAAIKGICGLSVINESGDMLMMEEQDAELDKPEYEKLRSFIGDRRIYFAWKGEYESLLFSSAIHGVAITNDHLTIELSPDDKRLSAHPDWDEDEKEHLEAMKEIIASGSYFDGEDTRDTSLGYFIAHGDVTPLSCVPIKGDMFPVRCLLEGKGFLGYKEFIDTARASRLIVSLSRYEGEGDIGRLRDRFYLITTEGEWDPSCKGLLPILSNPYTSKLYKEFGLSYFSDWYYKVEDAFSKDIPLEVVGHHLGILKAKRPERRSRGSKA